MMSAPNTQTAYDRVPYLGYAFAQTHPDRLATAARLFGMSPAPVTRCRVLELGCGDGGNLIPMGFALPDSTFVGLDLAAQAVARGQAVVAELGLQNVELRQADLMEVGAELGEFDYVIAHGLYSWVPDAVRDRLMELCRRHLAPQGVAFVSYNAYPGAYVWQIGRDLMRFHTRAMADPQERVGQAMSVLKFMSLNYQGEKANDLYGSAIREHLDRLGHYRHREHIFHDDLAEINDPVYFYQFAQHAARHGLQFLAETDLFEMQTHAYPPPIAEMLAQFPDEQVILKEQYLDFIKGRGFRQTLLCRADLKLKRRVEPREIAGFYLSSLVEPSSERVNLHAGAPQEFEGPRGGRLETDFPLTKAALVELREAKPEPVRFDDLVGRARRRLADAGVVEMEGAEAEAEQQEVLAGMLLAACWSGLVRLRVHAPQITTTVGERPQAWPFARHQAQSGDVVTNPLHDKIEVEDGLCLALLALLDGTRDRAALAGDLAEAALRGKLISPPEGGSEVSLEGVREVIEKGIDANLNKLARMGLLIG
jgi:methyltransferase-like protein/ubiquinone/menaquinone biosynthesis C-methylase UbiE